VKTIWLPDGASINVQWYISQARATGVEKIDEDWVPHQVGERYATGFRSDCDPPRDLPFDPIPEP
jgi:hypothetical protein